MLKQERRKQTQWTSRAWRLKFQEIGENSSASPDFNADTLAASLPSHDGTSGVPTYAGMVRGVFEVRAKAVGTASASGAEVAYAIEPGAPPGFSPLWILSMKKIEVPAQSFVCFGSPVLS